MTGFDHDESFLGRYAIWHNNCKTKSVRDVCILGMPHLADLIRSPHLFANKFHQEYHEDAFDLMEDWYSWKVNVEAPAGVDAARLLFDSTPYAQRACSKSHLP